MIKTEKELLIEYAKKLKELVEIKRDYALNGYPITGNGMWGTLDLVANLFAMEIAAIVGPNAKAVGADDEQIFEMIGLIINDDYKKDIREKVKKGIKATDQMERLTEILGKEGMLKAMNFNKG